MSELDLPLVMGLSAKSLALGWLTALPRLVAAFALVPIITRSVFPGLLSVSISAGFALVAAPAIAPHLGTDISTGAMLAIALKECVVGLMLGFMLALPFWAVELVGFLIDNQRGESISATLNPIAGHDTSTLGQLFSVAFVVFVLTSGGFSRLLRILYDSYTLWPPLSFWPMLSRANASFWLSSLNSMLETMLMLSAPVVLAMLLVELGLALVSHFAPQLQVFFLAMPLKSALALFVLTVYVVTMFDYLGRQFNGIAALLPRLGALLGQP